MPTHALGAGTVNLCVNVRKPVHRLLGRMAFCADVSMGALVRGILAGVETIRNEIGSNRRNARELEAILADRRVTPDEILRLEEMKRREDDSGVQLSSIFPPTTP